jgi:hypothetical protein
MGYSMRAARKALYLRGARQPLRTLQRGLSGTTIGAVEGAIRK